MLLTKVPKIDKPTAHPGSAPPAAMKPAVVFERFAIHRPSPTTNAR